MLRSRFVFFCALTILAVLGLAQNAFALNVNDIRFGQHPDKVRMVLELSESKPFRVFTLPNPNRIVIDLPSFEWTAGHAKGNTAVGVSAIRHGNLKPGISRIVMDMEHAITIHAAFALPQSGSQTDRLVIDFSRSTQQEFDANKGTVFGDLDEENAAAHHASAATQTPHPPAKPSRSTKPLVIIDPGHGGVDPGAIGANRAYEKHATLALGKELKKQLESTGRYRVILTRDKDIFIPLRDRVKIARRHEADLFISIHADSIDKSNVRGASFYTLSNKASDAQTAKLAARENQVDLIAGIDLSVEDKDVANILVDLALRDTLNQSRFFANTLVGSFKTGNLRTLQNPHRYAGFAVLKAPDIPSVLVEVGFMSNRKEAELLNTHAYRSKLATSLRTGIDAYFEQVRKNEQF